MASNTETELVKLAKRSKLASRSIVSLSSKKKNEFLRVLSEDLVKNQDNIIAANKLDLDRGKESGLSRSLLDRLALNEKRISEIALSLTELINLSDPIGEILDEWQRPNGLRIKKMRVPFGVIAIIYEARPNVTVDSAALAIKTGNTCLLRGSGSALETNKVLVETIRGTLDKLSITQDAVLLIEDTRRESVNELLKLNTLIDVVIPRGGAELIQFVVNNATIPVIETGAGNCHIYINHDANYEEALKICLNAKTQRPSVCNAAETFLIHQTWADKNLGKLILELKKRAVECRGCALTLKIASDIKAASETDWETEFNDFIVTIKVVGSTSEAIDHINQYGTKHSEAILTEDQGDVDLFFTNVDAAALYHNASTRFTDGFEFGFGAEIGISTQKLHARGPMGLKEITSYKYLVFGDGQVR